MAHLMADPIPTTPRDSYVRARASWILTASRWFFSQALMRCRRCPRGMQRDHAA